MTPVRALECAAPVVMEHPLAWRKSDGEPA